MPTASKTAVGSLDELENDLASLAAQAALELDHLALGRSIGLTATERLVDLIGNSVTDVKEPTSPSSLLNPATTVALGKAINEAGFAGQAPTTHLPDLIQQAGQFKERLAAIVRDPARAPDREKESLRNVCVLLSHQAVAVDSAARYRPEHPLKKYL